MQLKLTKLHVIKLVIVHAVRAQNGVDRAKWSKSMEFDTDIA